MTNQGSAKKTIVFLSLFMLFVFVFVGLLAGAQPKTHTVQKGDTLWDICQKYYGDPNLWPKLWEMNPFVTNPHLLKPGDIITLFETEPQKAEVAEPVEKIAPPAPEMKGVDVSGLTRPEAMGYLSMVDVEAWGFIEASTSAKLGLLVGDLAFVRVDRNADTVRRGQEFDIVKPSPLIYHPLTGLPLGYIVSKRGRLVIKEQLKDNHFKAEVTQIHSEAGVGTLIMPVAPSSACVYPMATDPRLYGNVVALKDNYDTIGQFSVVYIDAGFKDGVKRGSVFDLINIITIPVPNFQHETAEKIVSELAEKLSKESYLCEFWRKLIEGDKLHEQVVGKILVVEARSDTSTAIVLTSSRELNRGAFVKGVSWTEVPDPLVRLPSCPLE